MSNNGNKKHVKITTSGDAMRYSEKNIRDIDLFRRPNLIGSNINLDDYLGRIDLFDDADFLESYVTRDVGRFTAGFSKQFSDISKYNRNNWSIIAREASTKDSKKWTRQNLNGIFKLVSPTATGKTTYINHLTRIEIPKRFPDISFYTLKVDFTDEFVTTRNIDGKKIANKLLDELFLNDMIFGDPRNANSFYSERYPIDLSVWSPEFIRSGRDPSVRQEQYSESYEKDCQLIDRCIKEDPLSALVRYMNFINDNFPKFRFFIIIDNIDHYSNLNTEQAQSIIQTLNQRFFKKSIPCTIIFPIRDTTVRSYQDNDIIGAFHEMESIALTKINVSAMGLKRTNTILRAFEQFKQNNPDLPIEVEKTLTFISHIIRQLNETRGKKEKGFVDVWQWLDDLGNGDLRSVLDRFKHAVSSYHLLDTNFSKGKTKIGIEAFGGLNEITNPKRFKTALINCDRPYYDSSNPFTRVVNLFDAGSPEVKGNHILRLKVLALLESKDVFDLNLVFSEIIHSNPKDIRPLLNETFNLFIEKGLLLVEVKTEDGTTFEERSPPYDWTKIDAMSYVGPNGKLHLNTLIYDDIYLDEMKYSTNFIRKDYKKIFDDVYQEIKSLERNGQYKSIEDHNIENHVNAIIRKQETHAFVDFILKENKNNSRLVTGAPLDLDMIKTCYSEQKERERKYFHG